MELAEFYALVGGSAALPLSRLRSEAAVRRFIAQYREDPTFSQLCAAWNAHDQTAAFRAAHTLKGLAGNLGFGDLDRSASALTAALRGNDPPAAQALFQAVADAQAQLLVAIAALC